MRRATVAAAYEQLVAEGYLLAEGRSGTTVAGVRIDAAGREVAPSTPIFTELIPGEPDPSSFPRQAWAAALRKVLHTHPDSVLGYGDRQGLAELRLATLGLVPGSTPLSGGRSGARRDLRELRVGAVRATSTLHHLGVSHIAVEDPGLPPHRKVIEAGGPTIVPGRVDDHGVCVEEALDPAAPLCALRRTSTRSAECCRPPAGSHWSEWAHTAVGWIIEDDYDGGAPL